VLPVLAALGSALLVAIANVLQHRAGHGPVERRLGQVLRHPLWVFGALTGVAGFALHVLALSGGALALVQPLLVCGLLFALPLNSALERRAVRAAELAAAAAVVVGLAVFQLTARPATGTSSADPRALAWCVAVTVAVVGVSLACSVVRPKHRATWLGLGAGIGFGLAAGLVKSAVGLFARHGVSALTSWTPYAFVVVVTVSIVVGQYAFNAGPLARSLPILTIVDPLVSVAIGSVAFGETVSSGLWPVTGQLLGFSLMSIGVLALCRPTDPEQPEPAPCARSGVGHDRPSPLPSSHVGSSQVAQSLAGDAYETAAAP
jgi:drug/metabolite transporter (DMT)-like permease